MGIRDLGIYSALDGGGGGAGQGSSSSLFFSGLFRVVLKFSPLLPLLHFLAPKWESSGFLKGWVVCCWFLLLGL